MALSGSHITRTKKALSIFFRVLCTPRPIELEKKSAHPMLHRRLRLTTLSLERGDSFLRLFVKRNEVILKTDQIARFSLQQC